MYICGKKFFSSWDLYYLNIFPLILEIRNKVLIMKSFIFFKKTKLRVRKFSVHSMGTYLLPFASKFMLQPPGSNFLNFWIKKNMTNQCILVENILILSSLGGEKILMCKINIIVLLWWSQTEEHTFYAHQDSHFVHPIGHLVIWWLVRGHAQSYVKLTSDF